MESFPANDAPYRSISECRFGADVLVRPYTNLYQCEIGAGSRVGTFVEIQAGVVIGDRCKIQSHTFVCSGVTIGEGVFVGHGVMFVNDKHPKAVAGGGELATEGDWTLLPIEVEDGATIGSAAVIMGGTRIGANALIGAGAVVTRDVAEGATVTGIPARARIARPLN